ncbi:MAG: glycine oxidase ThiO [Gammaproteobacteria bacterium]|nr:MAG: glycine oxidase ThiO [Gammaproteobacteria bacterium]
MSPDFLIIGGGISGLLTARELANAGASITIIDKSALSRESSWAGGGILSPLYPWRYDDAVTALFLWSQKQFTDLAAQLVESTAIDPEILSSGLLIADLPKDGSSEAWLNRFNFSHKKIATEQIRAIAPSLSESYSELLWLPGIKQARNPRLLQALRAELTLKGVRFIEHEPISEIVIKDHRVTAIKGKHSLYSASQYIVCGGAWSSRLWPDKKQLKVEPVKGQMILFKAKPGLLNQMILDSGRYLIPRKDGRILVGSTIEYSGFDKSITDEALKSLKQSAYACLPDLKDYPIEKQWAGLRPGTEKGIPYIGKHPGIENLSANCGHFRNGFVIGPASARLLADILLDRAPIMSHEPYSIGS